MDSMKRRNPPETPKTENFDAEILLSLYREGRLRRFFRRHVLPLVHLLKFVKKTERLNP